MLLNNTHHRRHKRTRRMHREKMRTFAIAYHYGLTPRELKRAASVRFRAANDDDLIVFKADDGQAL